MLPQRFENSARCVSCDSCQLHGSCRHAPHCAIQSPSTYIAVHCHKNVTATMPPVHWVTTAWRMIPCAISTTPNPHDQKRLNAALSCRGEKCTQHITNKPSPANPPLKSSYSAEQISTAWDGIYITKHCALAIIKGTITVKCSPPQST